MKSEKSMVLICNEKKKVIEMNRNELDNYIVNKYFIFKSCKSYIDKIEELYNIKFRHFNISEASLNSPCFERFLQAILIKKYKCYKAEKNKFKVMDYSNKKSGKLKSSSKSPLRGKKVEMNSKCILI